MATLPLSFEFYPPKTDEQHLQFDRTVRKLIEEARREETEDGPFIVNACEGKGYFLARNADEIERHYRGEYSRAMAILVRTKGERKFLKKAGRL